MADVNTVRDLIRCHREWTKKEKQVAWEEFCDEYNLSPLIKAARTPGEVAIGRAKICDRWKKELLPFKFRLSDVGLVFGGNSALQAGF